MNIQSFMSITNEGYQSPSSCFLNFNETFEIQGSPLRLLIKFELESNDSNVKYLNAVYAINLTNPIFKLYPSVSINGIEFVGENSIECYPITNEENIKINVLEYKTNWDAIIKKSSFLMSLDKINKNEFYNFIGIGCVESANIVITNLQHKSKLSANLFAKMAKEFRKPSIINFNSLISYGFNEIEKNEIISIYEKKLIYQRILDYFYRI